MIEFRDFLAENGFSFSFPLASAYQSPAVSLVDRDGRRPTARSITRSKGAMPRNSVSGLMLVLLAVLLPGCDIPFAADGRTEVAVIPAVLLERPHLQVSDTVDSGDPILVTVTTAGPDGCYAAATTDVRAAAGVVRITPYHRVLEGMCTQAPVALKRTVELPPQPAGMTTVHVVARPSFDGEAAVLAVRSVVVR